MAWKVEFIDCFLYQSNIELNIIHNLFVEVINLYISAKVIVEYVYSYFNDYCSVNRDDMPHSILYQTAVCYEQVSECLWMNYIYLHERLGTVNATGVTDDQQTSNSLLCPSQWLESLRICKISHNVAHNRLYLRV